MKPQKILGIALLAVGVVLFVVGLNASGSIADEISNTFTGRFTQETMLYIVGGAAAAIAGLLLLVVPMGKVAV